MDLEGLNLDGLLQNIMANPELLQSAMTLAKGLQEKGGIGALFSEDSGDVAREKSEEKREERVQSEAGKENDAAILPASLTKGGAVQEKKRDFYKHRKLLEALSLYVDDKKRARLEVLVRLLDLMEFAGKMGL